MRVSLTFDDGPSEWTEPILDAMAERYARGTFFVCGWAISGNEHILQQLAHERHEIGNHGWSHTPMSRLSYDTVRDELARTAAAIEAACGIVPKVWRAPHHDRPDFAVAAGHDLGYGDPIYTTLDPGDWHRPPELIVSKTLGALHEDAIINLHDGMPPGGGAGLPDRAGTITAVSEILQHCTSVPVSELLA